MVYEVHFELHIGENVMLYVCELFEVIQYWGSPFLAVSPAWKDKYVLSLQKLGYCRLCRNCAT